MALFHAGQRLPHKPCSLFVCYHQPTISLPLFRPASAVQSIFRQTLRRNFCQAVARHAAHVTRMSHVTYRYQNITIHEESLNTWNRLIKINTRILQINKLLNRMDLSEVQLKSRISKSDAVYLHREIGASSRNNLEITSPFSCIDKEANRFCIQNNRCLIRLFYSYSNVFLCRQLPWDIFMFVIVYGLPNIVLLFPQQLTIWEQFCWNAGLFNSLKDYVCTQSRVKINEIKA